VTESPTAILFDIDGTLVDSNYLHAIAWRRSFVEHGHDIPTAELHRRVGMGSDFFLRDLIGDDSDEIKRAWRTHFDAVKHDVRALPGARRLLDEVAARGATVMLASSSEPEDAELLMSVLGDPPFEITNSGDVDNAKPEPDVFAAARERSGAPRERTLAVGDTVWDVEAAARAGLVCVAVTTGGISARDLKAAGAAAVYSGPEDLLNNLDTSPLGELLDR
jgi:HAD superfamily hydrolase (TIGR01509 family)